MRTASGTRSEKERGKPLERLPRSNVPQPGGARVGPPPGFITIPEACRRLGRHRQTVYRYIRRGLLRVKLVGWRVFVDEKSVEWWLKPRLYDPRRPAPPWLRKPQPRTGKRLATAQAEAQAEQSPGAVQKTPAEAHPPDRVHT